MIRSLLIIVIYLSCSNIYGQGHELLFRELKNNLKNANAKDLVKHTNSMVTIKILGEEYNCNKTQGEMILKEFFKKFPPVDYENVHLGKAKDGALYYSIGNYIHSKGIFKVYTLIKQVDGIFLIDTLDFSE